MICSQVRRGRFLKRAVFLGALAAASLSSTRCEADLPRVLLLGDSISIGYTPYVQQQLAGKAVVVRPTTSGGAAINCQYSAYGLSQLDAWLGTGHWDVIHFNWGIWDTHLMLNGAITQANQEYPVQADAQYGYVCTNGAKVRTTPTQYRDNLSQILNRLEQTNARLVFATTTQLICRRPENLVLVNTYNQVAKDLMTSRGIAIDDLDRLVSTSGTPSWYSSDGVHFTSAGYQNLGAQVSNSILVPEPSTWMLLVCGLFTLLGYAWHIRRGIDPCMICDI